MTTKKLLVGLAFAGAASFAPLVPQEAQLLYSYEAPCEQTILTTPTTTIALDEWRPKQCVGSFAASVFQLNNSTTATVEIPISRYKQMGRPGGFAHNPTKTEYVSLVEKITPHAQAAVAYDTGTFAQSTVGTSLTFAHTTSGAERILFVAGHDISGASSVVTGVTYNGVAMTHAATRDGNGATGNDRAITLWYLVAPASGANNVVVSAASSQNLRFSAISYTGVSQTVPLNGTTTPGGASVTTLSASITTSIDNCWMLWFSKDGAGGITYTNTTGDTIRYNTDAGGHVYTDTAAPISPAGANTITHTFTSTSLGALSAAFCPDAAAAPASFEWGQVI